MCSSFYSPDSAAAEISGSPATDPNSTRITFPTESYSGIVTQTFCQEKEHNCRIRTEKKEFYIGRKIDKIP